MTTLNDLEKRIEDALIKLGYRKKWDRTFEPADRAPWAEIDPIRIQIDELRIMLNEAQDQEEAEHIQQLVRKLEKQ